MIIPQTVENHPQFHRFTTPLFQNNHPCTRETHLHRPPHQLQYLSNLVAQKTLAVIAG